MVGSKIGKISSIMGIVHVVLFFLVLIISTTGIVDSSPDKTKTLLIITGITIIWCFVASILGTILGLIGLRQETEHKAPITVIGTVVNGLLVAFIIGMVVLGAFMS